MQMPMPAAERGKEVLAVVRNDGKRLRPENAWVVKKAAEEPGEWDELFGLFDCDGNNYDYQVEFIAPEKRNQPPLFEPIGQWAVNPSELIEFLVIATDEAGPPSLFSTQLPDGVSFDVQSRSRYASLGLFRWRPTADQVGVYPLKFFASDGRKGQPAHCVIICFNSFRTSSISLLTANKARDIFAREPIRKKRKKGSARTVRHYQL
jgi:hypothetical protein